MSQWMDVNGVSLRHEMSGSGPSRLVLIHEMGGALETWDAVVPLLPGFSILRYDMRGHGLSEKVKEQRFDDLVEDLRQLLDAFGWQGPVTLAGVAVGAAVAAGFALTYPARAAAVLLMAPATGIPAARRPDTVALAEQIRTSGLRPRVDSRLPATFPELFRRDPSAVAAFRGRALGNDPESYAATYRMLLDLDLATGLPDLRCPVLVLAGAHDGTRPPERVAADAALIPGARFEAVESGHVMPVLTPDLVAARLQGLAGAV
jgi:3-oxoadipate enol-lactonase